MDDRRYRNWFGSIVFLVTLLMSVPIDVAAGSSNWWEASVNVESKVGTDRSIQSLDVMYPLSHTDESLTFTDLRGRIDDNESVELNLGLAHRAVTENHPNSWLPDLVFGEGAVVGGYGFVDRLESRYDNVFYQATAGFEYFTKDYSLRINGYLPEDDREPTRTFTQLQATGTQIFFEQRRNLERPLPGYDVELGKTFRFDGWQLYGRGSYFRFHHSNVAEVEGSRFRTGVQFDGSHPDSYLPEGSQLTLGMEWQQDQVRDEQTFGVVRFRVPFGTGIEDRKSQIENGESKVEGQTTGKDSSDDSRLTTHDSRLSSWQKDRLTERIERDVDVVTENSGSNPTGDTQAAVLATTGETLTNVAFARGGASGAGTVNNPGDLSSAINRAGADGSVFVVGELQTEGVTLRDGQTVIGGNTPVIQSADGSIVSSLVSAENDPHIRGTTSDPTIRIDTGTSGYYLEGFAVSGENTALRVGDDVSNARIEDVNVTTGDLTMGNNVGRGDGNRFALQDVEVTSGNLKIGDNAGSVEGELTMDSVAVKNGYFTLGNDAGGDPTASMNGGSVRLTDVRTGDSMDIGWNSARDGGRFTLKDVAVGDSLSIGVDAGRDRGIFRMSGVTVNKDLRIGDNAGRDTGSFALNNVEVTSGDLTILDNAGSVHGELRMDSVTVEAGDLDLRENAGGERGTFRMYDVRVEKNLRIDQFAGRRTGSFTMEEVTVSSGDLDIKEDVGLDGSFAMYDVNVQTGNLTIGNYAGALSGGDFRMDSVGVGNELEVGFWAGSNSGSFRMNDVETGGRLDVSESAGSDSGFFELNEVTTGGRLLVDNSAGEEDGEMLIRSNTVESNDLLVDGGAARLDGTVVIVGNEVLNGAIQVEGDRAGITCLGNTASGSISCP